MVKLEICGWCKHYTEMIDGWLPACKAFPEGLPHPKLFEPKEDVECNNGVGFEVNEDMKESFLRTFHNSERLRNKEE